MHTVVVTGVTGGIGSAIYRKFVENGAFVVGVYHKNLAAVEKLRSLGYADRSAFLSCDFSDVQNATALGKRIQREFGTVSCLVNCAGIAHTSVFQEETDDVLTKITTVDLLSPMALTRELIEGMISEKKGVILNVSSIWGQYGGSCEVAYSAAKGGLDAFTKALSRELGASGIRVNALSCGFIDTDMNAHLTTEEKDAFKDVLSLEKLGAPSEVAEAAYFLCSDAASYITGQILGVDGGF